MKEIEHAAQQGDASAKRAHKFLLDNRFQKR